MDSEIKIATPHQVGEKQGLSTFRWRRSAWTEERTLVVGGWGGVVLFDWGGGNSGKTEVILRISLVGIQ